GPFGSLFVVSCAAGLTMSGSFGRGTAKDCRPDLHQVGRRRLVEGRCWWKLKTNPKPDRCWHSMTPSANTMPPVVPNSLTDAIARHTRMVRTGQIAVCQGQPTGRFTELAVKRFNIGGEDGIGDCLGPVDRAGTQGQFRKLLRR